MADPNLEIRPDFTSEPYDGIRHVMADATDTENEHKEAEKKKPKINNFDADLPPPSIIVPHPLQYTIQKLTSFESQADDAFGLAASNNILTIHPVASVKASKNAHLDHDLTFSEFLQ
ncbi:hypothetical protein JVT61DRAFT_3648 [Boletus reticuloceps]|uniref:Uncharacterized protein n=1 Tax=Boletus reticuloceps TaxID=495285 RepID=A0A8I2YLU2_9AGAM|nr:hypothetical protein JVT61DRAFT_3648 [Boletus reticuloceps]